jgi:glycosyltransferase involved in cell wall biosynthesis
VQRNALPAMRVALGTSALHRGLSASGLDGIGTYTQALLAHLKKEDHLHIVELVFRKLGSPKSDHLLTGQFHLEVLRSALTGLAFHGDRALAKKVDLFHATDHYIPKLKKTPVIATLMDAVPLMRPEWANSTGRAIKNWFFKRSVKWASEYITISQAVVPDLVECFGIPEEKITPIHLGVNVSDFLPKSIEEKSLALWRLKLKAGFFLFIGTLQPRKNVSRLLDAFEQLPKEIQREHPLVIVGRDGWGCEEVVERLEKLIATGHVYWLGYISQADKVVLLQSAIALVFPSLYEGFGLPVLEAFASRLSVITSNVSSLPEVAGDAACLVDPLDTEGLSFAMKSVVEQPEKFLHSIEKGYLRASEMTWARCAQKTQEIYRRYE